MSAIKFVKARGWSMYPTIKDGDILIIKKESPEKLKPGDIILFKFYNIYSCHRIIGINRKENTIYAKGDFNWINSTEKVKFQYVKGKIAGVIRNGKIILFNSINTFYLVISLILPFLKFAFYIFGDILHSFKISLPYIREYSHFKKKYLIIEPNIDNIDKILFFAPYFYRPVIIKLSVEYILSVAERGKILGIGILGKVKNTSHWILLYPYANIFCNRDAIENFLVKASVKILQQKKIKKALVFSFSKKKALLILNRLGMKDLKFISPGLKHLSCILLNIPPQE